MNLLFKMLEINEDERFDFKDIIDYIYREYEFESDE